MRQMVSEVQRASSQSQQHIKGIDSSMTQLATTAKSVGAAMGVAFSVTALVNFGKEMVEASTKMTSLTLSLKQATGGLEAARAELAFVRTESDRLGTSFTASVEGFTKLANATKGTALAGEATREVFTALSESNQALGLSTDQYGRALTAVSQIALKGRVQQEELLQLAEAGIPVYRALATALGVTTAELSTMVERQEVAAGAMRGMAQVLSKEMGPAAAEAATTFQGAVNRLDSATQGLLATLGDLITKNPEVIRAMNSMAESTKSFTAALQENMPTLQSWLSTVIRFIEKTGTLSTMPQDLKRLVQETGKLLPQPPELDLTLLGGGTQAGRLGLPGVYEQRLERYKASFAAIKKLQDEIVARERDLLEAPILGLTTQQVRSLGIELDTLRGQLAKLLDPQVLQQRAKATEDATQAEAKHAAETIAGFARGLKAQEEANEEKLEEERRVQREMQRIRDQVTAQMERDKAAARRQQAEDDRAAFVGVKQRIDAERQVWEATQREIARQQAELTDQVSDGLFGVLRGMTEGAGSMKEVWQDTLASLQATFLRTLSDMAAKALVSEILIPVGLTSGTRRPCRPSRLAQPLWRGHRHHNSARHGRPGPLWERARRRAPRAPWSARASARRAWASARDLPPARALRRPAGGGPGPMSRQAPWAGPSPGRPSAPPQQVLRSLPA